MRREIWEKNVAKIDAHNKLFEQGKTTFTMGENHLADRVSHSLEKLFNQI